MPRLRLRRFVTALLAGSALFAACDGERSVCTASADCASFCEQLGYPVEEASCSAGQCTCLEPPDSAEGDVAADATAATDSAVGDMADTSAADTGATDTNATDTETAPSDTAPADTDTADTAAATDATDATAASDVPAPRCPPDTVDRGTFCIDRWEAPNIEGADPFVMYSFVEAEGWCAARGKRLCFDDEWTSTCEGAAGTAYPYGDTHQAGLCNDDKTWRVYNQALLSQWPVGLPTDQFDALSALLDTARAVGAEATASADHVEALYQAEPSGDRSACVNEHAVFDLTGNVEEWTRRRDGGQPDFHGNLKGRYWAETRTCQGNILSHGDGFRFYEIGFRCCSDVE